MLIVDFNSKYLILLLQKLYRDGKFCFLMGDFNINLMKINIESDNLQFYNTMHLYFFMHLVLQPTRVLDKLTTLTGNIFFSSFEFTTLVTLHIQSLTTWSSFIFEYLINPKPPPKSNIYKRNFDNFDSNKLKEDLPKIVWINKILKNGNNIN